MEMSGDEIVGVIRMRHRFVPTNCRMLVTGVVAAARVRFGTVTGIRIRKFDGVFVDVAFVHRMKVSVV
jgi:hypothetical protein